jgi:hypothetical protein
MVNECTPTVQQSSTSTTRTTSQRKCSELGPYGKCTADGRFPFLMCTLKRVQADSEVAALEYYPDGTDWTSGVISTQVKAQAPAASMVSAFPINQFCKV